MAHVSSLSRALDRYGSVNRRRSGAVEATVFYYMFITLAQNLVLTGPIGDLLYSGPSMSLMKFLLNIRWQTVVVIFQDEANLAG